MRASLNLLAAFGAIWTFASSGAEARCDLTDPTSAAPPSAAEHPEPSRDAARPHALQALSAPPRQPVRAAPPQRAEPQGGRNVSPPARSAIPDTALMRKRRIL